MSTRTHMHEEVFPVDSTTLFRVLHTPSAVRCWWGAASVIIVPEVGGKFVAAWGANEDAPDYVTVATISVFEPESRIVMVDHYYTGKDGPLPFKADFVVEFVVEPHSSGALLRVIQSGFPGGPEADAHYAACETGWKDTFAGIRDYLK